jgi:hypothetical protein
MSNPIELIESAILDSLKSDPLLNGQVRVWKVLPEVSLEEISGLLRTAPAVGVIHGPGEYQDGPTGIIDETGIFSIVFLSRNLRSPAAPLHGETAGEAGALDLLEAARVRLFRADPLGLDNIISCRPTRRVPLSYKAGEILYALDVKIIFRHAPV